MGTVSVRVYWLDFSGVRILYGMLAVNQSLSEQTYPAHPWVITYTKDECKAIYLAGSQRTEIILNYR
jgi:von Hippel-Lindau disease tumor supressor